MKDLDPILAAIDRHFTDRATPADLETLAAFARQLTREIKRARGQKEVELSAQDVQMMLDTAAIISSHRELDDVLRAMTEQTARYLGVEACAILKWDAERRELLRWAACGLSHEQAFLDERRSQDLAQLPFANRVLKNGGEAQRSIDGPDLEASERQFMLEAGLKSLLALPLKTNGGMAGLVLLLESRAVRQFNPHEVLIGHLLARHASMAIERARLLEAAERRAAQLEALYRASLSLTSSLDLHQVLDAILKSTMELIRGSQDAHIFLYEDERLMFGAALWEDGSKGTPFAEPRPAGLTYSVARQGEAIVVQDVRTHPLYADMPEDWSGWQGSIVGLPLKIGERVVGVMNVANERPHAFGESSLRLLRLLGDQAAIAIENARLHRLVVEQARTDIITGLNNRRALDRRLEEEVQRSIRYGRPFSLIMIDLDNFKQVNDTYGHPVGDQILKQVGACLRKMVRDIDLLARFGGDEFALVLTETDEAAGEKLARRVQQAVEACELKLPDGTPLRLTVSMGMATFPTHADSATTLLVAADQALYVAKHSGTGKFVRAPIPG